MIPEIEEEISAKVPNIEKERSILQKVYDLFINDFRRSREEWGEYYKAVNEAEALQKNGHADQEV